MSLSALQLLYSKTFRCKNYENNVNVLISNNSQLPKYVLHRSVFRLVKDICLWQGIHIQFLVSSLVLFYIYTTADYFSFCNKHPINISYMRWIIVTNSRPQGNSVVFSPRAILQNCLIPRWQKHHFREKSFSKQKMSSVAKEIKTWGVCSRN